MNRVRLAICLVVVCLVAVVNVASADTVRGINIDFVTIDNAGNTADSTGYGAVDYTYHIGKYEVTNAQWNTFISAAGAPKGNLLNAYDHGPYYSGAQQPTNYVSWYETLQFCNYLTSSDKSKGAYLFSGNNTNPGAFLGIDRATAISTFGTVYVIPTEDEWYKAAYYTGSGYSLYTNGLNEISVSDGWNHYSGSPWNVGTGMQEQNGTFDMMGNVAEWNEAFFRIGSNSFRGIRGGMFNDGGAGMSVSSHRGGGDPSYEGGGLGFRVASIPEPATLLLLGLGTVLLRRKRSPQDGLRRYTSP